MINKLISRSVPYIAAAVLALTGMQAFGATATIEPIQDNTVAQELPDNSSGVCDSIFSGTTDQGVGSARRALMQFDLSAIPPGSIINSVTLSMAVTRGSNHVDSNFTLHPVNAAWVEGGNDCGARGGGQGAPGGSGVTWNTQPGFSAASGSTLIDSTSPVWNSTAAMVSDVQGWLDGTQANNGWILIGDEGNPTTSRRFDSREGGSPPTLTVDFTPTGDVEACCETDGSCSLTVVGSGSCGGNTLPGVDLCEPNQCPQPTGACCNADNSCSDTDALSCETAGGDFVGGNCNQADCGLTPFVEALPIPSVLQPTGTRPDGVLQYTVSIEEASQSVHPDLPDTGVWTYNGAWPAATIVAVKDQPIEVTYQNNLPAGGGNITGAVDTCAHGPNDWGDSKRIVTHLHGGHVPARVDGQPEYTILPGEIDVYDYPNNQEAATVWYHDHALGITRLNVYGGMAGFYLIADDEDTLGPDNAFGLPSGQYEIGLALQDRTFNADGSLFYNAQLEDAFKGDTMVVNGKVSPFLMVNQGKYRFRILNGSQSREYDLRLENITDSGNDPSFTLVGTDLGLVSAPIDLGNSYGTHAPAERMDVVIDFAGFPAGTEIILRNDEPTPPLLPSVMKFIVTGNPGYTGAIDSTLRPVVPLSNPDFTRYFSLDKVTVPCSNDPGRIINEWLIESLDGPNGNVIGKHWDDLSDFPILGNREVWEFENPTNVMHPMHVHLVRFQILSKTDLTTGQPIPLEPWEINTWKDIVRLPANAKARIIMDFEDYLGKFPQHCHILDHEDHEMMRQFQTTNDPANCNNNGTCNPGEDCQSCPSDCAQVRGASCGNGLCEAGDGENCNSCPEDCAGKAKGKNAFCCGDNVQNAIGCGTDVNDNRCIDADANLFCRETARVSACCGDSLCEGAETISSCANDCDPNACTPTEPGTEVTCDDGDDNDCDGLVDAADPDCDVCTPTGVSEAICNGVDDNCNVQIDEDYASSPTSCGVGVCSANGTTTCNGGVEGDTCTPGDPTEPNVELSCEDGLDNDCDGLSDAADPDCAACQPTGVSEDICNGVDDNCNDLIDEDYASLPTSCGAGICAASGSTTCNGGTEGDTCTPGTPGVEGPFGSASCNDGLDNDCDGLTDANDPNCEDTGGVVCEDITVRNDCKDQSTCQWKKNACITR